MQFTVSVTDAAQLLALQRALDAQNASRSTPLTLDEFVEGIVVDHCTALGEVHLVKRIDQLAFQMRFTMAERVAIRTAAQSNGMVADYLALLNTASAVVLTDALTAQGVQALEAAGLIGPGRAAEILAL